MKLPEILPERLLLEITPACNYKCPFCYCLWHEYPELASGVLSTAKWMELLDKAIAGNVRSFLFTGGEFMLRKDWKLLIGYAREKSPEAELQVFTNGSRLNEENLHFLIENRVRISLSLPGLRTYGEMTGTRRKFYKTIDTISRCSELGAPCAVGVTATAVNAFEIEDIVSAAAFAGASIIQVSVFMDAGRGKGNKSLILSETSWNEIKKRIKQLPCADKVVFSEEFVCKCMEDEKFTCPAGTAYGTISPNGTYRKCLHCF